MVTAVAFLLIAALQRPGPQWDPPAAAAVPDSSSLSWLRPTPAFELVSLADTNRRRPRAIEYSDFYGVRLEIHRAASYATIPLFLGEFALGQSLYAHPPGSNTTRTAHSVVALGVAGLFGVNTITGVWNLWESRHDPADRPRKYIHAALMLLSDAGFVATGAVAPSGRRVVRDPNSATIHRNIAFGSMAVALAGYGMMLIWKK